MLIKRVEANCVMKAFAGQQISTTVLLELES